MKHSSLGPSSWDRWVRCPGSIREAEKYPDETSWEAAEGTAFHWMVAACIQENRDPEHYLGTVMEIEGYTIEIDAEMAESAYHGLDFIREVQRRPGWECRVEEEVDISYWCGPDQIGNADMMAWSVEDRHIIIFDWKYGRGVPVHPDTSYQVRGYALGAWEKFLRDAFPFDTAVTVDLIIEQPRIPTAGGTYRTDLDSLLKFGQRVQKIAMSPTNEFNPGDKQCTFCPARKACTAHAEWCLETLGMDFEDLDEALKPLPLPPEITPERRSALLLRWPHIKRWHDDLHKSAYRDAEAGRPTPGLKLRPGRRPARKWDADQLDEVRAEARGWFGDELFTPSEVFSPAKVQATIGRKRFVFFKEFVVHGEPKLVLAADDGEPGITPVLDEFEDLDGKESVL